MSDVIRLDDDTAHEQAIQHAVSTLGLETPPVVCWDVDHHLQGHLDVCGRHMVLIAPRTSDHRPRLFSETSWDRRRRDRCRTE